MSAGTVVALCFALVALAVVGTWVAATHFGARPGQHRRVAARDNMTEQLGLGLLPVRDDDG